MSPSAKSHPRDQDQYWSASSKERDQCDNGFPTPECHDVGGIVCEDLLVTIAVMYKRSFAEFRGVVH